MGNRVDVREAPEEPDCTAKIDSVIEDVGWVPHNLRRKSSIGSDQVSVEDLRDGGLVLGREDGWREIRAR